MLTQEEKNTLEDKTVMTQPVHSGLMYGEEAFSKCSDKDTRNEKVNWAFIKIVLWVITCAIDQASKRISLCKQVCPETQSQNVPVCSLSQPLSQHCEIPELRGIWCEQDNTAPVKVKWPLILTGLQEFMSPLDPPWLQVESHRLLYNNRHSMEKSRSVIEHYFQPHSHIGSLNCVM